MDTLVRNRASIIFSCIQSNLDLVDKELMNLLIFFGKDWKKKKYKLTGHEQIETVFNEPDDKSMKILMWTPQTIQNDFTVFINNFSDGWVTLLNEYSIKYNKRITMATLSDQNNVYSKFEFYHRNKVNVRIVQVLKEVNEWKFFQDGDPLTIEDANNYRKKKIIDRLNNKIIENYMKKLGFDFTKNEFWISKGEAIENTFKLG